jgi:DNA primase large subunit
MSTISSIPTSIQLRNVGIEEMVDIFGISPDFNEKITRYQINHITKDGKRDEDGRPVGYHPPSCDTLKSHSICKDDGSKLCEKANHPLGYYNMKNWVLNKQRASGGSSEPPSDQQ